MFFVWDGHRIICTSPTRTVSYTHLDVYKRQFIRFSGLISFIIYTLAGTFSDRVSQAVPCPFTLEAHRERPAHAQTANKNKRFMTLYFKKLISHSIPPLLQSSDTRLPACCPRPVCVRSPTVRPNDVVPTRTWNGAP